MKAIFSSALIILFTSMNMIAVQPDRHLMDFWVGEWNCTWQDSVRATNHVRSILNEKVIEENFSYLDGSFTGRSWSMYDSAAAKWRQTWVDDSGAFFSFTGRKEGDQVIFEGDETVTKNGQKNYRRMIFYSIKNESFEWDWQGSTDHVSWNSLWHIKYTRKN
ncbi:MAG TPA: hypothetical protein PKK99_12085 [Bacteroidia bacterium]|nr:hypothetical protein [Bacteroidia bacterium]